MKLGVISDIHGNCYALDAVLADIEGQGVDRIVCLGDAIQGGAEPAETVHRLRQLACPVVMGNADAWLLTGEETGAEETTSSMLEVREWSLSKLSESDRAFIAAFHPTVEVALGGGQKLLCAHGSPTSFDDVILPETPEEELRRLLGAFAPAILAGGHTHTQFIRHLDESFFFNPGSVGMVYDPDASTGDVIRMHPWGEYAILTAQGEDTRLEFHQVPLDVETLIGIMLKSGRPYAEEAAARYGT